MAWTKTKTAIVAAVIVGIVPTTLIIQNSRATELQRTNSQKGVATESAIYTYNLQNTPIEQLLSDPSIGWSRLTGLTLLKDENPVLRRTITLQTKALTKTEAIKAIEEVLKKNGITIVRIDDKTAKLSFWESK